SVVGFRRQGQMRLQQRLAGVAEYGDVAVAPGAPGVGAQPAPEAVDVHPGARQVAAAGDFRRLDQDRLLFHDTSPLFRRPSYSAWINCRNGSSYSKLSLSANHHLWCSRTNSSTWM